MQNSCSKKNDPPAVKVPGAPVNVSAVAGDKQAIISFSAPADDGGSKITGYIVVSNPGNIMSSGTASPITVTGLSNGVSYSFIVKATNAVGTGSASVSSNSIIPNSGPVAPSKNCVIATISQFNNGSRSNYALTAVYDPQFRPVSSVLYDSVRKIQEFSGSFSFAQNSIKIGLYETAIIDPVTQLILVFNTKEDLSDPSSDDYTFEYLYNDSGYLAIKNQYVNHAAKPTYKTTYQYDNTNLLVGCTLVSASTNRKILESTITYETALQVRDFLYPFPDGFEIYMYTPILNFGKKMKSPVKTMTTKVYDPVSAILLDTWTSSFGGYSVSPDGYITQGTQSGDQQQGFPLFYGKTAFGYSCK